MTKHDPSEVEAVSSAILDAYNTYVEGTSSLENMGGHYTQWIHEPVYPDVLAEAAITALDAHRAPQRTFTDILIEAIHTALPTLTEEQKYAFSVGFELSAKGKNVRFDTMVPVGSLELRERS